MKDWHKEQREDPCLVEIILAKEEGRFPVFAEKFSVDVSARIYRLYRDALYLKDGILYKKWFTSNLKSSFLQLVVPKKCIQEILEQAHDSSSGGHFGVNKTF